MNSLMLTDAGPTDSRSGRTFLGGGGGTTRSSGIGRSSAIPSNTGEACPAKSYHVECMCIMIQILMYFSIASLRAIFIVI